MPDAPGLTQRTSNRASRARGLAWRGFALLLVGVLACTGIGPGAGEGGVAPSAPDAAHADSRASDAAAATSGNLAAPSFGHASLAWADEGSTRPETAYELQQRIEAVQADYSQAQQQAEEAARLVSEHKERVDQIEREIPRQQERSARATRDLYKLQQQSVSVVTLLVSAGSLQEFLSHLEYVTRITDANFAEINRLAQLKDELDTTREELEASQAQAEARVDEVRMTLEAAQEAQAEAQRRLEEEARLEAEAAANAKQLEEQPRDNTEGGVPAGGNSPAPAPDPEPEPEQPTTPSGPSAVDPPSSSDEATFVAKWAPRIDAYLAGSPMAGQGESFARAAYAYNVDPRFSPAIACTESGKGRYCFLPHNAWGWGSCSWESWEEAIDDHVRGLANGYGYTISVEGAKKYCPPNWEFWYNNTSSQMDLI